MDVNDSPTESLMVFWSVIRNTHNPMKSGLHYPCYRRSMRVEKAIKVTKSMSVRRKLILESDQVRQRQLMTSRAWQITRHCSVDLA